MLLVSGMGEWLMLGRSILSRHLLAGCRRIVESHSIRNLGGGEEKGGCEKGESIEGSKRFGPRSLDIRHLTIKS